MKIKKYYLLFALLLTTLTTRPSLTRRATVLTSLAIRHVRQFNTKAAQDLIRLIDPQASFAASFAAPKSNLITYSIFREDDSPGSIMGAIKTDITDSQTVAMIMDSDDLKTIRGFAEHFTPIIERELADPSKKNTLLQFCLDRRFFPNECTIKATYADKEGNVIERHATFEGPEFTDI
jgi:hypothetical protein